MSMLWVGLAKDESVSSRIRHLEVVSFKAVRAQDVQGARGVL